MGDGDNVRIFHTPGGRLMGWDWVRRVPKLPPGRGVLKDQTVSIYSRRGEEKDPLGREMGGNLLDLG